MSEPSDPNQEKNALRDQIIGLGSRSLRKSYYPQLQAQIDALEKAKAALEEKSDSLLLALSDLETARQHAEENERKFRTLFEGITDGVIVADTETRQVRKVNPAFCQILGYSEAELLRLTLPDIHPSEELPRLMAEFSGLSYGAPVLLKNRPFKRKDGTLLYTEVNSISIDLENRHCALGVCRDITERKLAEEQLRERDEWMRYIIQHDPNAVAVLDNRLRYIFVSNRFLQDYNLKECDIIGRCHYDVIPEMPEKWKAVHRRCLAGAVEKSDDDFFERSDGSIVYNRWECRPWFHANGKIGGIIIYSEVITERKLAEQALAKSERKYRELVENANSIILRWSPDGLITYLNEFGLTFFGYSEEEIVGRQLPGTIVPETESTGRSLVSLMSEIRANPKKFEHNINENIRRNGERIWIAWTNKVVLNNDGQIKEILSIGSDVTERVRAEVALKQAKEVAETANRAKDQFIAVLSHELRTPLTPVLTTIALLQSHEEMPDEIRAEMDVIHRNVELEAKLIDDLLDVTRISRGIVELRREDMDAHACIMKTLEICRSAIAGKGVEVSLSLRAKDHHVWADSARLQQVFWNLLNNAVKFTPEEGRIAIRTTNRDQRLKVEVADTGIGIEPEILPRIFNAFEQGEKTWTRRFGGLGLGLSIAKAIVDLHKGSLTASSEGRNKGAVFTVELETIASAPGAPVESVGAAPQKEGQRKILLVEDHADTLRILSRLLQKWGYHVKCSTSVAAALDLAAHESFDILVSDIGLPDGSGLDIMRQTKERYGLRGVALSGFGTDDDRNQSRDAGFEEHLTKPVGVEGLRAAVERILSAKAGADAG